MSSVRWMQPMIDTPTIEFNKILMKWVANNYLPGFHFAAKMGAILQARDIDK